MRDVHGGVVCPLRDFNRLDLLPPDDWDVCDGTKAKKKVLSLPNPGYMRLVLIGMTDNGFFNEPKSLTDVAKHLYIGGKEEEKVLEGGVAVFPRRQHSDITLCNNIKVIVPSRFQPGGNLR